MQQKWFMCNKPLFIIDIVQVSIGGTAKTNFVSIKNTAFISVLLMPNTDPTLCKSYHSLSLINTDTKTISKI